MELSQLGGPIGWKLTSDWFHFVGIHLLCKNEKFYWRFKVEIWSIQRLV